MSTGPRVDMVRGAIEPGGRNRFAVSLPAWIFLLELGKAFGWQPQGTTYVPPSTAKNEMTARHGYRPGDDRDYKEISTEDALNWARSLETAKSSPYFDGIISSRFESGEGSSFRAVMEEFTEYAYGGSFAFAETTADATS